MKTVARLVTRASSDEKDGLIIGVRMKGSTLKPGRVYEVREILGELVIVDVGPTAIKETMLDYSEENSLPCCWGHSIGHLLECDKEFLFLTEDEAKEYLAPYRKEKE